MKMNSVTLKILLSLFAINSVSLYLYFSSHPDYFRHHLQRPSLHRRSNAADHHLFPPPTTSRAKPWPILPSYLPWSLNSTIPFRSCEGYFGNGFTTRVDILKPELHRKSNSGAGNGGGWFRCFYSDTLRSSICEGGRIRLDPEKIRMSAGGEMLESVIGRREEEEMPVFEVGAFDVDGGEGLKGGGKKLMSDQLLDLYVQSGAVSRHAMRELIGSIQLVGTEEFECSEDIGNKEISVRRNLERGPHAFFGRSQLAIQFEVLKEYSMRVSSFGSMLKQLQFELHPNELVSDKDEPPFVAYEWVEEPTLLITRYEYANLFHTVTDWYSAYVASRVTGLPNRPHLVFVDGHCVTPLEETWKAMFSSLRYAKNFSGTVCFRHGIFTPLGYETAIFQGLTERIDCRGASAHDLWQQPDDHKTARLSEFGEMIRAAFGFPVDRHRNSKPVSGHNVLFVRREDYLAHPRHGGKVQSRLSNEQQVFDSLKSWALNHLQCKVNVINGIFAHMPMKEQVRAIQDASVIVGAHGAGLTHIVSATPKTVVLEIISSEYVRPHFQLISQWKGLEYHAIYLDGSRANPTAVIDKLSSILKSIGC
ncbi:hypothetical protein RJ639_010062 [Escallonia herrerae]|uniref:Glycosyltransferase 61 catalytic domain-containing protein n=1 Tax=Escallonia herrerae TaxID=1293975 RepID=A0AA88VUY8_9ASTE|nr:hypothetical protein RJ639_010062 [Escallonia herrerae]